LSLFILNGAVEMNENDEDLSSCIFESDATAIRIFVRELVAQSVVPTMERLVATWNEQILSRRKGISGRFISLSKRFSPFGGSSSRNSSSPIGGSSSNTNYDSLQGFYRPDAPEALMRKLADYAFMLRDYKLATSTYDVLRQDYQNDKAWRYYAGANEMTAISILMNTAQPVSTKTKTEAIDQILETASYTYTSRCAAPYNAVRTLSLGLELLKLRGGSAADDAARWAARILEMRLVGPVGHALVNDRVAACYASRLGIGSVKFGSRKRKAALWSICAAEAWLTLEKGRQAEKSLNAACTWYDIVPPPAELESESTADEARDWEWTNEYKATAPPLPTYKLSFAGMQQYIDFLRSAIEEGRRERLGYGLNESQLIDFTEDGHEQSHIDVEETVSETLDANTRSHRKSLIGGGLGPQLDAPLSPLRSRNEDEGILDNAGFE
jgi:trafficking protein particle complex subunit 8